ncbi:hypothetical protein VIGAN_04275400 [Vigna angularis var. angularis]|uniref:Cyclic nucleotide-binding domain-containing protein n=1 Tax=Vigna angularis var. angularis TaxID=157739 RepID=A0A0S3RXQ2_PHAAN|nr:hypothetical protein VIGAN_04275400 [Vigna angularis var. angularis]
MQQAAAATPKLGLSRLEGEVDHHLAHGSRKVQPAKRRNVPCTTASSMLPAARWASRFQLYRQPSSRSPATIGHRKQHTTNTSRKGAVQHLETAVGPGRESMARPWEKNATGPCGGGPYVGQVESSTTDSGRTGFYNSITLRPGDFCGEELLTWALMSSSNLNLPSSTRTVKSILEVEAFALRAEDLKFVSNQFKQLHSKKLQHAFCYYSH